MKGAALRTVALLSLVLMAVSTGCTGEIGGEGRDGGVGLDSSLDATCPPDDDAGPLTPSGAPLSHSRWLRRVSFVLHGRPPHPSERAPLLAAETDEARTQVVLDAIDAGLRHTDFYEQMLTFGHHWMRNGHFLTGAQGDGYWGNMSSHLGQCGADSAHPGAYHRGHLADVAALCSDAGAPTREETPWWAPDTTITLVGDAASLDTYVMDGDNRRDCGIVTGGYYSLTNPNGCGCGPHAMWCYPGQGLGTGHDRQGSQRREMWEEPARLVAHLAWHDRPLSDVVLGNYTVATNAIRAWYLRFGRQTGLYPELDERTDWFRPASDDSPRDPLHPDPADTNAWRELVPETLAPQLLSLTGGVASADPNRTFRWDPRTDDGPAPGLPAAGVLTMPGPNSSFPRERPRAARFLEIFACREFDPPPTDQHFPALGDDLATTGSCMHCHAQMDPVAIAFRRWVFIPFSYVALPALADLGNYPVPDDLFDPARRYPYGGWFKAGADRWRMNWLPDTTMTPVPAATAEASPRTLFMDTIPPEYALFGEHTDGTMGPLGFAKVLVSSGVFDRCAVRRIYERVVGRPLDPAREARAIDVLAEEFASQGRQLRPMIRALLQRDEFRRGL